jgi:hypothetical protein
MQAIQVLVAALILYFSISDHAVNAQSVESTPRNSSSWSAVKSKDSRIIRISTIALRITIDDDEQPFRLENLDRRFDAKSLTKFLTGYMARSGRIEIVITSITKRNVDGEQEFNEFLERISRQQNAMIVFMPPPTGDDPDIELKNYAAEFESAPNRE